MKLYPASLKRRLRSSGVARERIKGNTKFFNEALEAGRRGKRDFMSARHQAERERKKGLNIAAGTVGKDGYFHNVRIVPLQNPSCYTMESSEEHP